MSFDSLADFLAMGRHGLYVWLSYGSALIVVLANVISVRSGRQRFFRQTRALARRGEISGTTAGSGDQTSEPI